MEQPKQVDLDKLILHKGKWVALDRSGAQETVVGSGVDPVDALEAATVAGCRIGGLLLVPLENVKTSRGFSYIDTRFLDGQS